MREIHTEGIFRLPPIIGDIEMYGNERATEALEIHVGFDELSRDIVDGRGA